MFRPALAGVTAIGLALAIAGAAFSRTDSTPTLVGTTGPGYHITLKTKSGKLVKTLSRGTYRFVIHDKATIHAFSMDGPHGFDHDFTKIPFVGTKTSTIKLKAGKYKYYCPNHESIMFGHFTVK